MDEGDIAPDIRAARLALYYMTPSLCPSCQAALLADARFCARCGTPVGGGTARRLSPWAAAAGAAAMVVAALGLAVWRGGAVPRAPVARPAAAPAVTLSIPDISNLTPRERFDRLYAKILEGLRTGDTMALSRFAPMALGAYEMLDSTEADSTVRRQVTLLRLHLGDTNVAWPARAR